MAQWTRRLTTNQEIQEVHVLPGSSFFSGQEFWLQRQLKDCHAVRESGWIQDKRSCGPMEKAPDYESGDCRFEPCQDQKFSYSNKTCFLYLCPQPQSSFLMDLKSCDTVIFGGVYNVYYTSFTSSAEPSFKSTRDHVDFKAMVF